MCKVTGSLKQSVKKYEQDIRVAKLIVAKWRNMAA